MFEWIKNKFAALRLRLKGWKTRLFNIGAMAIPFLELAGNARVLEGRALLWFLLFVGIVNLILRQNTTGPVGSKQGLE